MKFLNLNCNIRLKLLKGIKNLIAEFYTIIFNENRNIEMFLISQISFLKMFFV